MKKRLLSALLALALVFVLLPTTALAEVVSDYFDCDISILGNYWKFEKDSNNEYLPVYYKSEASSFEDSTVAPENNYLEIRKTGEKEITITVHGDVNITATGISIDTIAASKSVIINGDGHLTVKYTWTKSGQNYSAIDVSTLTVEGVALSAEASMGPALFATYGIHIKDGAMVEAKAGYFEAVCEGTTNKPGGITVDNATLVATATGGGNRSAIKTYGDIAFTNAKVTATNKSSENAAIQAKTYEGKLNYLYVSGTSTITATNQSTSTDTMARAIGATIKNNNTSEKIEVGSSKVDAGKTWYTNAKQVTITSPALERDSDVLIAGKNAVVGQWTNIPAAATGTGSYYYDADKKELTLKDVNITHSDGAIVQFMAGAPYIIKLEGTNSIKDVSSFIRVPEDAYESLDGISVTISGSGSLEVTARSNAITMLKGDLVFNNTGAITLETNTLKGKAINVSGNISIGDDFNKNLRITADNGDMTFDPTNQYTDYNDLKNYKSITIASKPSETYYNGTAMKYGETRNAGSGTISCDENGVITLSGATAGTLEFRSSADSTLVLEGTNTLSSIVTTQKGLTISGSGSLTVGSIRVTNNDNISADLTINGGAHVTVNRPSSEDEPAVEVSGNLTVTGDGTQLSAECTAATNPAIEVGGNASFTGSTVTITNNSTKQGKSGENSYEVSTGLYVGGTLDIKNAAKVTSTVTGGNAIYAKGDITISGNNTEVKAQNSAYKFSAISTNGTVNISDNSTVKAENGKKHQGDDTGETDPSTGKTYNACPAITGKIANKNTQNKLHIAGFTTSNAGSQNPTDGVVLNLDIDPSKVEPYILHYDVTITRGDAYETPQVAANYTIAGQTMYVGKYYKTDTNGNITDGTAQDYNIYCDSENDFTLNNATISSTGTGGSTGVIKTNLNYSSAPFHIKLIGTNSINNTGHHAILGEGTYSRIIIENAENASNASLTISGNFLPVYSFGDVTINAEVVIKNTDGKLISTNKDGHANGAFDLGSGYKCYASTSTTGTPLEEFNSANYSTYKYLRVTTQTPETGGGSTHEHVWDEAWHDTGDYHHAHQCTICKAYDTTTQELHNVTGHRDNHDGSHSNICGSCGYSAKVSHSYTWAPNANDNEKHIGTCVCGNVVEKNHNFVGDVCSDCGYDKSTGTTCEHVWTTEWTIDTVDNEYHWHKCIKCNAITDKKPHAYTIVTDSGTNHIRECECKVFYVEDHISSDWIIDTPATATTAGSMHKECTVCKHKMQTEVIPATGEIEPPTPDNPGTIVIIRPAEEEKPAQQPNPSTGANDLVGMAVAAAVVAVLGSVALLRKHD